MPRHKWSSFHVLQLDPAHLRSVTPLFFIFHPFQHPQLWITHEDDHRLFRSDPADHYASPCCRSGLWPKSTTSRGLVLAFALQAWFKAFQGWNVSCFCFHTIPQEVFGSFGCFFAPNGAALPSFLVIVPGSQQRTVFSFHDTLGMALVDVSFPCS